MAKNKVILVDADVISHFMATGFIDKLTEILNPHTVLVVENVYKEAGYHPTNPNRKLCNFQYAAYVRNFPCMAPYVVGREVATHPQFAGVARLL